MLPKVIVMVGLMGSGKSTAATKIAEEHDAVILSSDKLREEFPGKDNEYIFLTLHERAKHLLTSGKSIVIDATNTTIKTRSKARAALGRIPATWVAYVMATPFETCLVRLKEREKPDALKSITDAVRRYYLNFQLPMYGEGFEEINIIYPDWEILAASQFHFMEKARKMINYDQKTHWHKDDLYAHSMKVRQALMEESEDLRLAALYHDIGKPDTRTFDENEQAHYYGHASVGAYHMLEAHAFTYKTIALVNYHMMPFSWETEKANDKYRRLFGEEFFSELLLLHNADINSHRVEE